MKHLIRSLLLVVLCVGSINSFAFDTRLYLDPRFCGYPLRNASGEIVRSSSVLRQFEKIWPMPLDGRRYIRDHVVPLACGGCDALHNLQWLTYEAWLDKSKWERKVYGGNGISKGCP